MNREAGAYIEVDGVIQPDLNDEAMAGRKKLADGKAAGEAPVEKTKKGKAGEPPVEVTNA